MKSLSSLIHNCRRFLSLPNRAGGPECRRQFRRGEAVSLFLLYLLTVHFVRLPLQKMFAECLWDFLFTLLLFAITLRILPRRVSRWVGALAVAIFAIVSFVEAYLYQRFHMVYDPTMFTLLAETNAQESSEFLSLTLRSPVFWHTLWLYLLILLLTFVLNLARRSIALPQMPRLVRHVGYTLLFAGIAALVVTQVVPWWQRRAKMVDYLAMTQSGQVERVSVRPYYSSPLRLMYALKYYGLMQQEVEKFCENTLHSISPTQHPSSTDDITAGDPRFSVILVIGESYNKYHAHLYGYSRPTTPYMDRLCRQGSLIPFTDVVTPWNITSQVFKWMLSTQSINDGGSWADGTLWPALFHHAGWTVDFITNQYTPSPRQNKIDLSGSFFLNTQPLDSLAFTHRNLRKYQYDAQLINELDTLETTPRSTHSINPAAPRRLLIFHLIGQHLDARQRVPSSWLKWTAADYASRTDLNQKERQTLADYDNATLYNDYVIHLLVSRYQSQDALIIYLADHGEEVYDFGQKIYGRNHARTPNSATQRSEYEVPFVVWGSAAFRSQHPDKWQQLQQAASRPFMTDDLCHLLFGLTDLPTTYYQPSRNPLSPHYQASRPRLLKGKVPYKK